LRELKYTKKSKQIYLKVNHFDLDPKNSLLKTGLIALLLFPQSSAFKIGINCTTLVVPSKLRF